MLRVDLLCTWYGRAGDGGNLFAGGTLPWQGLKAGTKEEKYAKIMEKKMNTSLEQLTAGLPSEWSIEPYSCVLQMVFCCF